MKSIDEVITAIKTLPEEAEVARIRLEWTAKGKDYGYLRQMVAQHVAASVEEMAGRLQGEELMFYLKCATLLRFLINPMKTTGVVTKAFMEGNPGRREAAAATTLYLQTRELAQRLERDPQGLSILDEFLLNPSMSTLDKLNPSSDISSESAEGRYIAMSNKAVAAVKGAYIALWDRVTAGEAK